MAGRIIRFDNPATQQNMIERLEETLEQVRNGEVRGLTIVALHDNEELWVSNQWVRWLDAMGCLHSALITANEGV
jgi:hypothetical protein